MQPPVDANLVDSWIALCHAEEDTPEYDAHFGAFGEWFDMRDEVDSIWALILAVLAKDQSNRVLEDLSAGPLEDLLADHGEEVIDRVEREAKLNPDFARLLGGVWQSHIPLDVWQRVQAVWDRRGWDGNRPHDR